MNVGQHKDLFLKKRPAVFRKQPCRRGQTQRAAVRVASSLNLSNFQHRNSSSEGVQHIALETDHIFATVRNPSACGMEFVVPPARYDERIDRCILGHGLSVDALREHKILVDGSVTLRRHPELFLQAFIKHYSGEISFEIVRRGGHHGFGEGNPQALEDAR